MDSIPTSADPTIRETLAIPAAPVVPPVVDSPPVRTSTSTSGVAPSLSSFLNFSLDYWWWEFCFHQNPNGRLLNQYQWGPSATLYSKVWRPLFMRLWRIIWTLKWLTSIFLARFWYTYSYPPCQLSQIWWVWKSHNFSRPWLWIFYWPAIIWRILFCSLPSGKVETNFNV